MINLHTRYSIFENIRETLNFGNIFYLHFIFSQNCIMHNNKKEIVYNLSRLNFCIRNDQHRFEASTVEFFCCTKTKSQDLNSISSFSFYFQLTFKVIFPSLIKGGKRPLWSFNLSLSAHTSNPNLRMNSTLSPTNQLSFAKE